MLITRHNGSPQVHFTPIGWATINQQRKGKVREQTNEQEVATGNGRDGDLEPGHYSQGGKTPSPCHRVGEACGLCQSENTSCVVALHWSLGQPDSQRPHRDGGSRARRGCRLVFDGYQVLVLQDGRISR